ncbi:MAG: phosphate acyltransferase PlsX [Candidatus Firestonebacteria bacterium]
MKIALDAMGGDNAPETEVRGAVAAAKEFGIEVILVGDEAKIKAELDSYMLKFKVKNLPISIVHASEIVTMNDTPTEAYKQKKDSSLMVAMNLVKEGKADAIISAGNTGAVMAHALFVLGRIKNVSRPAIAAFFPSLKGKCLVLDVGANADNKPKHLLQFAVMGSVYLKYIGEPENPRIGLLSVGEEEKKGNELTSEAAKLLRESGLNFVGNVEGRDIVGDKADVIVCDGFIGNIILKFAESIATRFFQILKVELQNSSIFIKFGAWLVKPVFRGLIKKTDYAEHGAAPLLGIDGQVFIGHGSSSVKAIKNAIKTAAKSVTADVNTHIREEIQKLGAAENE